MSLREGTRGRKISIQHMLGTWEGKIEGCNCPRCKECLGEGKPECFPAGKNSTNSLKGAKSIVSKGGAKSKVTGSSVPEESSVKNNAVTSDSDTCDSEEDTGDQKLKKGKGMRGSGLEEEADKTQNSKRIIEKQSQRRQSTSSQNKPEMHVKAKHRIGQSNTRTAAASIQNRRTEEDDSDSDHHSPSKKTRRISSSSNTQLGEFIAVKEEPKECLSDIDNDSNKPAQGRNSETTKGERSSRRARMVTSEVGNIYAKPRMIFTGRGVVQKVEPGVDSTPKPKKGKKPGKALVPVNVKQEPKEPQNVKKEMEGTNLDELQKALTEAAENISGMGDVLVDAFQEFTDEDNKEQQKAKPSSFFTRLEGNGEKCVECNICFKVLKESSMKQHYKTHIGLKPHFCDLCDARFTRKGDVERHKRLVHKSLRPFKCMKCTKEFSDRKSLKAHLQNHDKAMYYGCPTCGFKFGKKEYYENHIQFIHPLPDGTQPVMSSSEDDDLAAKQLKYLEIQEQENIARKNLMKSRMSEIEKLKEADVDDDDEEDDDNYDKALEITVTNIDDPELLSQSDELPKKDSSLDEVSTGLEEQKENKEEESNTVTSAPAVKQKTEIPTSKSSIIQLPQNTMTSPLQPTTEETNMKVSKGMLSLTQTLRDSDSQDEDLVNKAIAAAVSQATDAIESLQAKSAGSIAGSESEFEEDILKDEEGLEEPEDLQDILGEPSYELLPIPNVQNQKAVPQQPVEIHITASVSGQLRKFIIQIPPGTKLNVQTPEGMEMIVNIVNQLVAGKGELDGPIEVMVNTPSSHLMVKKR